MKKKWIRRGINLLFKLSFLVVSVIFLVDNMEGKSVMHLLSQPLNNPGFLIPLFFILWAFNLWIDALFWQKVHLLLEKVSVLRGFKINLVCYTLAFITPANSGEWAGRYVMMTETENRKKSFFLNFWMHLPRLFSKLLLTSISATILLIYIFPVNYVYIIIAAILIIAFLIFIYFSIQKFQNWLHLKSIGRFKMENYLLEGRPLNIEKAKFLLMAGLKFLAYNAQFGILLYLFSEEPIQWFIWLAIPVYYLIGSLVPSFAFADFILKSAIAIWLFQPLMQNEPLLILASIAIWMFNVVIPSFAGLGVILKTDLLQSFKKKFSRDILNGS